MSKYEQKNLHLQIDTKDLKPLFRTKPWRHAAALAVNWMIIFGAMYLSIHYFNAVTYILAVIVIGARMHALAILMHDATHYRFLKNRKWNDLITNLTVMYPVFSTLDQYRQNHLRHHQHLNTEDDPDWVAKLGKNEFTFPKTKREFLLIILSYFTLYQGTKDVIWFLKRFGGAGKKKDAQGAVDWTRVGFYLFLFSILTVFGLWKYYAIFWVIPYLSTFFMFQYIRSVAEHFGELAYDHVLTSTRSVKANMLERFLIAPHHVGYHLEHHLYPGIPFYNLPKVHQLLMKESQYQQKAHITQGYVSGLLKELEGNRP